MALLAVSLGVALAWSVHLINRSALGEFAAAVRSANGDPDLTLAGQREGFDDALFAAVLADEAGGTGERGGRGGNARPHRERCLRERRQQRRSNAGSSAARNASSSAARNGGSGADANVASGASAADSGERIAVRVLGVDALRIAALAPALLPLPRAAKRSRCSSTLASCSSTAPRVDGCGPRRSPVRCAARRHRLRRAPRRRSFSCRPDHSGRRCAWPATWPSAARR
ncbi:MAG: hypothetical protein U1F49_18930 [Rubrivivax sp.]